MFIPTGYNVDQSSFKGLIRPNTYLNQQTLQPNTNKKTEITKSIKSLIHKIPKLVNFQTFAAPTTKTLSKQSQVQPTAPPSATN